MRLPRAPDAAPPSSVTSPRASGTNPISALNSVDFPEPLMPTRAQIVASGMRKLAPSSATLPFR